MGPVKDEFFDIINYCICSAVTETVGVEEARKIFRRMGRIHYEELKRRGIVRAEPSMSPMDLLESIARYLESSGYVEKIAIRRIGEEEAIVDMYGVSVLESSVRLVDEGKEPSHIMTNTMSAALEDMGYSIRLVDLLFDREANHVREKWILKREK